MALKDSNPFLRIGLIRDEITVDKFIRMPEKELVDEEEKKRFQQIMEYTMQANRTDQVLADQMKKNTGTSMYMCIKCKGENVSMYTQQTRSADEPMTEFYNCLDCSKQWRICP